MSTPLQAHAQSVARDLTQQRDAWGEGFTRRRFLAGLGTVGVATLGSQLVTTKAAIASTPGGNTLINVFLRGGADGLAMLIPASAELGGDYLRQVRPDLPNAASALSLAGSGGWALNPALRPLLPFWKSGELVLVPAVSNGGISRSHFQAQSYVDLGGQSRGSTGWMDRLLAGLGPGTTFRAIGEGKVSPASFLGTEKKLVLGSLRGFTFPASRGNEHRTATALTSMYRGLHGSLPAAVNEAVGALKTAAPLAAAKPRRGVHYPGGSVGGAFADIATLLRAETGVEVAAIDIGGWDTHTAEAGDLAQQLGGLAQALAAFMQDLGQARRSRVTVTVTTEFGRRIAQNAAHGSDHGHGSVMMILGGGLRRSQVAGRWTELAGEASAGGDVPGLNDPFQIFAELAHKRLGASNLRTVFPTVSYRPLGIVRG